MINFYVIQVRLGKITINQVPKKLRDEVKKVLES
mgnify:CR=1 FL=1